MISLANVRAGAQVVINEYSCSNLDGPVDSYGEHEDWVELYNNGATTVTVSGYFLSDDKNTPMKWQIPSGVTIPGNGRKMVFCSDRSLLTPGGEIHTSFKLTQTRGEYFVIADPSGTILDSVKLIPTQANHSRGRVTDGASAWGLFSSPTPNTANTNAKTAYASKPAFSLAAGFYNTVQTIVLTSPDPNTTIYFTLDGTIPTTSSIPYSSPVQVFDTKVIRARAVSSDPSVLPSFTETNTYLINENTTLNVVSVSGAYDPGFTNLLFTPNFNSSIEFFGKDKQLKFEMEGIVKKHGNDSWAYSQKGLRFYAKDQLGYDYSMRYKMFGNSTRDTFGTFILDAGGSDNFPSGPATSIHLRDAFCHTLSIKHGLDLDARNYEPAILFVNGAYWGIYEMRERVDEDYAAYYYAQPKKKVDMLKYWGGLDIEAGSDTGFVNLYNFITSNNMSDPANYQHVTDYLNVNSFAQYFIFNTWLVNSDWLNWNTMWWRGRDAQGVKWRYALWDQDNVLALGQNYTGIMDASYQADPCEPFSLFLNNANIKHTDILTHLMQNTTFNQLYRNTFIDMLNGPLNCNNMLTHLDSLTANLQVEMQRHCTRWGGSYTTWLNNVQFVRNQIIGRCSVIAQKLDSCMDLNPQQIAFTVVPDTAGTIAMNSQVLGPYVWSQVIAADTVLHLTASPGSSNYVFEHWEKYEVVNHFTPDSLTAAVDFSFSKKDSVVAFFKYLGTPVVDIPDWIRHLTIPTAFTPNGDGRNDYFRILNASTLTDLEVRIYNRWGGLIFQSGDPAFKWDGTFRGAPAETGTYYYVLVTGGNSAQTGTRVYRGEITLIR